jgi:hypothetical protein
MEVQYGYAIESRMPIEETNVANFRRSSALVNLSANISLVGV